jgi:hypothetical protein
MQDTPRADAITDLEARLEHALSEVAKYKPLAEKWEPRANVFIDPQDQDVRFVLSFGGKRATVTMPINTVAQNTVGDITSAAAKSMFETLVVERIGEVLAPEVEKVVTNARAVVGVGKW